MCSREPCVRVCGCTAAGDGSCPICLEMVDSPSITPCGHIFCHDCILEHINEVKFTGREGFCPMCRVTIALEDVLDAMPAAEEAKLAKLTDSERMMEHVRYVIAVWQHRAAFLFP